MDEIGFNTEYARFRREYDFLREQVATQLEEYTHLVEVVGPNLKASYMMLVGQLEHRVFELKTEVNRWKRRFALRQQALNRGEKPDFAGIEGTLDEEFAAYLAEIKKHIEQIKEASAVYHSEKMSDEETTEIRYTYLKAVKKLHPDINPDLPPSARDLWNQIQAAYGEQDWKQLRFLVGLVDDVVSGETVFQASSDGLAALRSAVEALRGRSREIAERTARLKSSVPFTYKVLLEDEDLVRAKQAQIQARITALEACIDEYEELWNDGK